MRISRSLAASAAASVLALSLPALAQGFAPGDIIVSDTGNGRLVRVDPASFATSIVSTIGADGIAADPSGNLVAATSIAGHLTIARIDPSGAVTAITQDGLLSGFLRGVAVDAATGEIYVSQIPLGLLDGNFWSVGISHPQIIGVDPATGVQHVVSDLPLSWSKGLWPMDLAVEPGGKIAVANGGEPYGQNAGASLVEVDPLTGAERVLPGNINFDLGPVSSVDLDWDGTLLAGAWHTTLVQNWSVNRVDPTGDSNAQSFLQTIDRSDYGQAVGLRKDQNGDFVILDGVDGSLERVSRATFIATQIAPAGSFAGPSAGWGRAQYLAVIPGGPAAPPPMPYASFKFAEGQGTTVWDMVSGRTAQIPAVQPTPGGARWTTGRSGAPALDFNQGGWVDTQVESGLFPLTAELWVYIPGTYQNGSFLGDGSGGHQLYLATWWGQGNIGSSFPFAWSNWLGDTHTHAQTGWNHVVQTWTGTGTATWLNGVLVGRAVQGSVLLQGGTFRIGGFTGAVDEANFFRGELTPAQIAARYQAGLGPHALEVANLALPELPVGAFLELPLEARYGTAPYSYQVSGLPAGCTYDAGRNQLRLSPREAGSSDVAVTVTDASGATASRVLTLRVQAPLPVPSDALLRVAGEGEARELVSGALAATGGNVRYAAGKSGSAFDFDGNSFVDLGHASLNLQQLTVEAWVKSRGKQNLDGEEAGFIVSKYSEQNANQEWNLSFAWRWYEPVLSFNLGGGFFNSYMGKRRLAADTWYHLAGTYDGQMVRLYVDGELDAQYARSGPIYAGTAPIRIGADSTPGHYPTENIFSLNGLVDDAAVYGRALGADEIRALYLAGAGGKSTAATPPVLNARTLATAFVGNRYEDRVAAVYGLPPYTFSIDSGALPEGLALDAGSGVIEGVPSASAVNSSFTIRATDAQGLFATQSFSIAVIACGQLTSGLFALWEGDGNARDSIGGRDGALYGGVTYGPGRAGGQAFSFPGQNWAQPVIGGYVEIPSAPVQLDQLTVETWYQIDATDPDGQGEPLISQGADPLIWSQFCNGSWYCPPPGGWGFGVMPNYGYRFQLSDEGISGAGSGLARPGAWHHAVATWDGATERFYEDGVFAGAVSHPGPMSSSSAPLRIGQRFAGSIDRLALYDRALSPDEVQGLSLVGSCPAFHISPAPVANAGVGQPFSWTPAAFFGSGALSWSISAGALPPGLQFDPATGRIFGSATSAGAYTFTLSVTDASGAVVTRTVTLTVEACAPFPAGAAFAWSGDGTAQDAVTGAVAQLVNGAGFGAGTVGQAFALDGSQAQSIDAGASDFHAKAITLEAWVHPESFSGGAVIAKSDRGDNAEFALTIGGSTAQFMIANHWVGGQTVVPTGSWTHVAGTYDGQFLRVYVNGVLDGEQQYIEGVSPGTAHLRLGATDTPYDDFTGFIDEAAVYSRALAPEEIAALAHADADGKCHALTVASGPLPRIAVGTGLPALYALYGVAPYRWSATGRLPPGVALNQDGSFAGAAASPGVFGFTASVTDASGAVASRDFTAEVVPSLIDPLGLYAMDEWGEPQVWEIDRDTQQLSLVTRLPTGEGLEYLLQDPGGDLYGAVPGGISRIDARTAAASDFAAMDGYPWRILAETRGSLLAVHDSSLERIERPSGAVQTLSHDGALGSIWDVATGPDGRILALRGGGSPALIEIDADTGAQLVRQEWLQLQPFGIAADSDGSLIVGDAGYPGIWRIVPATGQRTLIARLPYFYWNGSDLKVGLDGFIYAGFGNSIFRIDPQNPDSSTAATEIFSDAWNGVGALGVFPNGDILYTDPWGNGLYRVSGGNQQFVSWEYVPGIAQSPDGSLLYLGAYQGQLVRLDQDGTQTVVASGVPSIWCLRGLVEGADGALYSSDQCSGMIEAVPSLAPVSTDPIWNETGLAIAGGTLYAGDGSLPGIQSIDVATSAQSVFLQDPPAPWLYSIGYLADGRAVVEQDGAMVAYDFAAGTTQPISSHNYLDQGWGMWPIWLAADGTLMLWDDANHQAVAVDTSVPDDGTGSNQQVAFTTPAPWTAGIGYSLMPAVPGQRGCAAGPVLPDSITALAAAVTLEAPANPPAAISATATDACDGSLPVQVSETSAPGAGKVVRIVTRTYSATDAEGKSASFVQVFTVQDTTPPAISGLPQNLAVAATGSTGAAVSWPAPAAADAVDGAVPVACSPAAGSTFAPGVTTVTCSAADARGNSAQASFTVAVSFAWSGYLPPITSDGKSLYTLGRTVPVKFALSGSSATAGGAPAYLYVAKVSAGIVGTYESADSTAAADVGNQFRYTSGQYVFNLDTSTLSVGTWQLNVDLRDGVQRPVLISIKQ